MDAAKRKRLEEAGFRVGSVADFLELTQEQNALVEVKVALSLAVRQQRQISRLSQNQLAEQIGSSQSRVAKMEAGDASVSLDLLLRALLAQGMTRRELADVIAGQETHSAAVSVGCVSLAPASNTNHYKFTPSTPLPKPVDNPGNKQVFGA